MTILVTGGRGLLGRTLSTYDNIRALGADALDIRDSAQIDRVLSDFSWEAVINCAAYTAVDRAETEIEAAYAINCDGADKLARGCRDHGIPMIHVSTDYVFDGTATQPYREDSPIAPINVYGSSKAAGERAVHDAGGIVVRTSWLFGERGPSFVHTIVRKAREQPVLRVVADQHGRPTYAGDLAAALIQMAARTHQPLEPTYHFCNTGEATWYVFASAIVDELRRHGEVTCKHIEPITTAEYPTTARRPANSVLDTRRIENQLGIRPSSWIGGVRRVVAEAAQASGAVSTARK